MGGALRFSVSHISMLFIALVMLGVFVTFQQMAIDRKDFLFLMFSSFFFLGAGTLLTIITFVESYEAEKYLCLGVAIVFIVATLFVANSLGQVPRGGAYRGAGVTPESFTLADTWSARVNSQIIYSADYPVAFIWVSGGSSDFITIRTNAPASLNATVYFWMKLGPYEQSGYALMEPIVFKDESMVKIYPHIFKSWGTPTPANRTRLEGYYLELKTKIHFETLNEPSLNLTFDMSDYGISIHDFVVDSSFQNGLSIILSGIFIGIICYIPGNFLSKLWFRKLLEKRAREREMYTASEEREKILALIIVTFSFLSVPVLLFLFFVLLYINANYLIQFYNTRSLTAALMTVLLAITNAGLFFLLRALIKWVRK